MIHCLMSSKFSSNSEAFASELLENVTSNVLEKLLVMSWQSSILAT